MKLPRHFASNMVVALSAVLVAGSVPTAATTASAATAAVATTGSSATRPVAASATRGVLPAGRQGRAASIPWSKVGPGWLLSEWSAKRTSAPTLFLVDPLGGRYTITSGAATPSGALVAWSGDGARALFAAASSGSATAFVTVLQLRSGKSTTFTMPGYPAYGGRPVNFTEPDGLGIIVGGIASAARTVAPMQRYDLQGALEYTYPTSFPRAGRIEGEVLYSPDGTELVMATTGGFEVVANGGQPVRYLPMSAAAGTCQPLRWWAAAVVLASCAVAKTPVPLLWLVPTDGRLPTQLTVTPKKRSGDYGDVDAWALPSGDYVQDLGACGYIYLAKVGADRRTTPVDVPGAVGSVYVIGAYGDQLALATNFACQEGNTTLFWFNAATRVVTPLLGPRANGGSAGTAILFGQTSVLGEQTF